MQNRPMFGYLIFLIVIGLILWAFYSVLTAPGDEAYNDFISASRAELSVKEMAMRSNGGAGDAESIYRVSCFAELVNNSEWRWGKFNLQAEFYSSSNELIDVHTEYDQNSALRPGASAKFRVSGNANAGVEDYESCTLKVLDAR